MQNVRSKSKYIVADTDVMCISALAFSGKPAASSGGPQFAQNRWQVAEQDVLILGLFPKKESNSQVQILSITTYLTLLH